MGQEESIGRWISLIHRQAQIYLGNELRGRDIGSAQIPFLMVLYNQDGLTQEEMARILHVDKATSGRDIKRLVDAGYVTRKKDTSDRRAYHIYLTDKGKNVKAKIRRILRNWTSILSADLSDIEYEQIIDLLKRMNQNALRWKESNSREGRRASR